MNSSKPKQPRSFLVSCLTVVGYNRLISTVRGPLMRVGVPAPTLLSVSSSAVGVLRRTVARVVSPALVGPRVSRVSIHTDLSERVAPEPSGGAAVAPDGGVQFAIGSMPSNARSNQCPSLVSIAPLGRAHPPAPQVVYGYEIAEDHCCTALRLAMVPSTTNSWKPSPVTRWPQSARRRRVAVVGRVRACPVEVADVPKLVTS